MKNAPDFVIYVVMVKPPNSKRFNPYWLPLADQTVGFARGFSKRKEAVREMKICRVLYGKNNAYVQQYGPYWFGRNVRMR